MTYDAIVVGAGPAGSTAAIELARQGRSVAIIERSSFPRRKVCGEFLSATTVPVLRALGVEEAWRELAGPEVQRVAMFAGERIVEAPMPNRHGYGRALGRDVLDTLLLRAAAADGAVVHQPYAAKTFERQDGLHAVSLSCRSKQDFILRAPVLIAAHGSWERGALATNAPKSTAPSDMLGFKAHFRAARLSSYSMPLLAFPGGYGGMVWADNGRLSLSLCIRRDTLTALRAQDGASAADTVQAHLMRSCRGVREVLSGARRAGDWLATGPIRPGIRPRFANDIFRVGNVAGEAHPVVAEGVAMAIQSASLAARAMDGVALSDPAERAAAGSRYSAAWADSFAFRIRAARLFAEIAMRPVLCGTLAAAAQALPSLLTLGAELSGKTQLTSGR